MKYLKIYEEFGTFHLDEISKEESDEMNNRNDLKYREGYIDADITHTRNKFIGHVTARDVDRYTNTNYKVRRLIFSFGYDLDGKKFYDLFDFVCSPEKEPKNSKKFTVYISKYERGEDDEPQYMMTCHIRDPGIHSIGYGIWKYFVFEESDFKLLLQDPNKYVEIIVNNYLID